MPLSDFQRTVLCLLAEHRSPDSFFAGGTVINASPGSPRYSDDMDIFHDAEECVISAANTDTTELRQAGFEVERTLSQPGFQRALVSRGGQSLRLEWAQDSAFRFFPVQPDEEFGWRLHLADLATNKVLALASRWKVRDFIDTLYLDDCFASLGLLAWAAAGKDPGLTPHLILEQATRFNRLHPEDFRAAHGRDHFDYVAMKTRWRESVEAARELVAALPPEEVGALYLDTEGRPTDPRTVRDARPCYASLGGVLPQIDGSPGQLPDALQRLADDQTSQRYGRI